MTVFDLDEKPGSWFEMEGGGRIQLKPLSAPAWKAIRAKSVKLVSEYQKLDGKWERFEVEKKDDDLQNTLFWDAVIISWSGLFDGKGNEIPCTAENKALLMLTQPKFSRFIGECIEALNKDESARAEALEKN
jgi:hypothetical protein